MVTGQIWTFDFSQKITRFLLIQEKVSNGKKIYDSFIFIFLLFILFIFLFYRSFIYQGSLSSLK